MSVPTIDFGPFLNGTQEEKEAVAKELFQAASTVGFMMLKNFHSAIGGKEKVEEAFDKVSYSFSVMLLHLERAR
jgi:isopenicillin N synthase-like dioxygenase